MMKRIKRLVPDIGELLSLFNNTFNSPEKPIVKIAPASIMLLGDHTQYNDGILLSAALRTYAKIILSPRGDSEKNVLFNSAVYQLNNGDEAESNWVLTYIAELIKNVEEREEREFGFDLLVEANFPIALGIGRYSAIGAAVLLALDEAFEIQCEESELVNITQGTEKQIIELISNRGNHFTSFFNPPNSLVKTDLRKVQPDFIPFPINNYRIVITDTKIDIKNPASICAERIEECQVGVKGLRLYIWGIKNLRDVGLEFLEKHYHMIPHLVYKRCYYNVLERIRVEKAIKLIKSKRYALFGKLILESHENLNIYYDLSTERLNYLVETAKGIEGVLGSKMISCSPRRAVYHLVHRKMVEKFVERITAEYGEEYGEELDIHEFKFSEGVEYLI